MQCWSALGHGLLAPPSEWFDTMLPRDANLRHKNGVMSSLDAFPRATPIFEAEWLIQLICLLQLTGSTAMQAAVLV